MLEFKAAADGTITGYASLFGGPADLVGDIVAPGAFKDAALPLMLREHKGQPVGTWTSIAEDEIGLRVTGTVTDAATLADLRAGRLDGLSIGYVATKSHKDLTGKRVLEQVNLQEISVVKRPASSRARVLSVKSAPAGKENQMDTDTAGTADEVVDATEIKSAADLVAEALAPITTLLEKLETVARRPGASGTERKSADDTKAVETKAFGGFIRRGRETLDSIEVKALRVSDDSSGGFLAPHDFRAELLRNLVLISPIRSIARVDNTSAAEVLLPRRTGTATAAWTAETDDRSETSPTYGQNRYTPHEMVCFIDVSQQLLEDAALNIEAELARDLAEEFGRLEGVAFVNGTRSGQPQGFVANADVGFTVSGSANAVTADSLIDLFHAVKAPYRSNGTWVMNSTTVAAIRKLKTGNGEYLLNMQGINNVPTTTILGRPVVEAPDMPDIGAGTYPVAFGDFSQGYRVFDRVNLSVLRDPYSVATKGLVRFHARRRVAGGVALAEAIRKLKVAAS